MLDRFLLSLGTFVLTASSLFGAADWKSEIRSKLSKFGDNVGLSVRSLSGEELLQINGARGFLPASTAKLISSACVLEELGTAHTFKTTFGTTTSIDNGVLKGDLVIKGSGDPSYVIEDFRQNLEILRNVFGLKEIRGQLIFDVSYLGLEKLALNEDFLGDEGRSFAVELTALPFNHNSFSIWVLPQGESAKVVQYPLEALEPKIINRVRVVSGSGQNVRVSYDRDKQTIVAEGTIGREASPRVIYRSVEDPFESMARVFRRIWLELGGKWTKDTYLIATSPVKFQNLWIHESKPVSRLLLDINKLSTNFGSELITLAAAAKKWGGPANFEKTRRFLTDCIKDFEPGSTVELENASGLSRKSRVSPSAFTKILAKTRKQDYFPEFLSSLSVLGRDGTTRSRLGSFSGRARLKTGSIKGVRSIAGFLDPNSSQPLVFALIFNQSKVSDSDLRNIEDEIMERLLEIEK